MSKSQLVEQVAKDTGLSAADARRGVDSVLATVQASLKRGEVSLTGFGRFSVVKRAAREGRDPQTGEPLRIRAGEAAKFTPAPASSRP